MSLAATLNPSQRAQTAGSAEAAAEPDATLWPPSVSAAEGSDPFALGGASPADTSQFTFLRYVAGMRAVFALAAALSLLPHMANAPVVAPWVLLSYLSLTALSLFATLRGHASATHPIWYWIDAAFGLVLINTSLAHVPGLAALLLLPVIGLSLQGGVVAAVALGVCTAAGLVAPIWMHGGTLATATPETLWLRGAMALCLLACGPMAAHLSQPERALRQRMQMLDAFRRQASPRRGLAMNVDAVMHLLHGRFAFKRAYLSLAGPLPRIFCWRNDAPLSILEGEEADRVLAAFARVPQGEALVASYQNGFTVRSLNLASGRSSAVEDTLPWRWITSFDRGISLPIASYGQHLGHLWLAETTAPFTSDSVAWLSKFCADVQAQLERADLLEQLQHESALRERERIGRDLHDSAIQPYIGLKYGLEALARQAGPQNPLATGIRQLVQLTTDELQSLRDLVGGLRAGHHQEGSPLAAIERQAKRFGTLYGLKVSIFAPLAARVRGPLGKAVLHVVNEALTNVRRHSSATSVTLLIDSTPEAVTVRVRNDHGPGEDLPPNFIPTSILARAREMGGDASVVHEAGLTELTVTIPAFMNSGERTT